MDLQRTADNLNLIAGFLGRRDIESLNRAELKKKYSIDQADLLILFGGSIASGCDIAGKGMKAQIAKKVIIAGGEGHTTDSLRQVINSKYPDIITKGRSEAVIMNDYIKLTYGFEDFILETESTNCGNNVTNVLDLIRKNKLDHSHIIIVQDASMQLRMAAGFRKHMKNQDIIIINFAAYKANIIVHENALKIEQNGLWGMWTLEQYITLLMGEIPRLNDNIHGYGPKGKNFISHVDIPEEVLNAYKELIPVYGKFIRAAVETESRV